MPAATALAKLSAATRRLHPRRDMTKVCSKCHAGKELSSFSLNRAAPSGLRRTCKSCDADCQKAAAARKLAGLQTVSALRVIHKKALLQTGHKKCNRCNTIKPIRDFAKDLGAWDALHGQCKPCGIARVEADKAADPEKFLARQRENRIKKTYGMTIPEKEYIFRSQEGRCAICKILFLAMAKANIDHVHGTCPVIVRGLLCSPCNLALGLFKDSPAVLKAAINYLERPRK